MALQNIKNKAFQLFSIALLFLYVSVQSPLHEIIKLPSLVDHFIQHQTKEPNISFFDFIEEHYLNVDNNTDDIHKKLPFKDENHPLMIGFNYVTSSPLSHIPNCFPSKKEFIQHYKQSESLGETRSIWQPPRA